MTSYYPFTPTQQSQFQFHPSLDGQVYIVSCPWGLYGQRYYFTLSSLTGETVVYRSLVGSPAGTAIQSLSWQNGIAVLETSTPHGYRIGGTVNLTISGCVPDGYNGTFPTLVTSATTMTYPVSSSFLPPASTLGAVSYDIDLIAGYGFESTIVFRESLARFEVSP